MKRRIYKYLFYITIIFIFYLFFTLYIGSRYLKRLNKFISENNNIIIKNELSNYISENKFPNINNLYNFTYNNDKEIVGANINTNYVNSYMMDYLNNFKYLNDGKITYEKYLKSYYKYIKTKNNTYLFVPIGIIYENPFIFNLGPNVILSYSYINNLLFNIDIDISDYGLNNVLVNIYLDITFEQSVLKPILSKVSNEKYRFLLSSQLVYGRVSSIISDGYSVKSTPTKIK